MTGQQYGLYPFAARYDWKENVGYGTSSDPWQWQPTRVFLPWRIPGTGEPGGLPSMGSHRVGHD